MAKAMEKKCEYAPHPVVFGESTRVPHTKGHPKRKSNRVHQFIISPLRGHSQKPDEARDKIIELVGDLPRVELFAREKADGWDAWGNEIDCDLEIEGYCEKTGGDFVVG